MDIEIALDNYDDIFSYFDIRDYRTRAISRDFFEEILSRSGLKSVVEYMRDGKVERIETDRPEKVMEEIFSSGSVEKVTVRHPNLEDVFLKLTGRSLRE